MKVLAGALSIPLLFILLTFGCSKEDAAVYPDEKLIVRGPIKTPVEKATPPPVPSPKPLTPVPDVEKDTTTKAPAINNEDPKKPFKSPSKEKEGIYVTQKGDTLSRLASRKDFYGDKLKWPILYRHNRESLGKINKDASLPDKKLTEGIKLKIITPDEVEKNLRERSRAYWVINVISSPEEERIVPLVIRLIDDGYPVYVSSANVKGKDWMRLRIGFFRQA